MIYLLKKTSYVLLTLWGVASVVFFLFTVLPGDPAQMMLDQNENSEQLAVIKTKYGFDRPILHQYAYYVNDLSPFSIHSQNEQDFTFLAPQKYSAFPLFSWGSYHWVIKQPYLRESYQKNGVSVSEIISNTLPNTVVLALSSILIALLIGIGLGIVSALNKDGWFDRMIQLLSTMGMSVPSFFSAILFSWFFGFVLKEYTHLNMTGSLYELDDFGERFHIQWRNLILPSVVLGIRPIAVVTQLMRNSLLDVLQLDYIRTAYSKGLSKSQVVLKHALKNALNPVITAVSGWFSSLLAGAVFVEYIFGWNGLGKEIVGALNTLDVPVLMGSVLVIASLVDLLYGWLDPKVRVN
jgi:peptide/nickel transport system permease protein